MKIQYTTPERSVRANFEGIAPMKRRLDGRCLVLYAEVMGIHFSPELQAKLDRAAADARSGSDEYVQQLVESNVDHDPWFHRQVEEGLSQLNRGEFLTHEEVGERLKKFFACEEVLCILV